MKRHIQAAVAEDLQTKMVFVGGPRQVGKTTLALSLLRTKRAQANAYFNWDVLEDREKILAGKIPPKEPLVVLDEIHKFSDWRNFVKGLYDKRSRSTSFLVTGSARLDYYRHGGDSLQGRYHYHRLHPYSLLELTAKPTQEHFAALLAFGGFPEPLYNAQESFHRRWQRERTERVLQEDLRDLERVREVSMLALLLQHLPRCVASPLSIHNLAQLLQVSHATMAHWLDILERLYVCFRISPYGLPSIRAVKKEQKLYFWDWSQVTDNGARFENLVASQLLKYCHHIQDTEGYGMELRYIRDTDKREVDFVVLRDSTPEFAVECKLGDSNVSPALHYFRKRLPIPLSYQVHAGKKDSGDAEKDVRLLPFLQFCLEQNLP